jgi:hypothetical protein
MDLTPSRKKITGYSIGNANPDMDVHQYLESCTSIPAKNQNAAVKAYCSINPLSGISDKV